MNAEEFVASWKREKDGLLVTFTDPTSGSAVSKKIASLNLPDGQQTVMKEIVNDVLTDAFYTLLMGLDGEANIGGVQAQYKILDEKGNTISSCGELEAEAWRQFHGDGGQPGSGQ